MKVAVVRNRAREGVINRFGQPCPEVYGKRSVQMTLDALRAGGHRVAVLEGDKNLLAHLEAFMPPDAETGRPGGMVFNMAYGIQGQSRYTHVPAMLEMAGVPYTGAGPLGHTVSLDKVVTKILMQNAGVPTPNFKVMNRTDMDDSGLTFPLIVKPRHESTSYGLHLAENRQELEEAVLSVVSEYQQNTLVEEYIDGREVAVGLLGNQPAECLPLVEFDFGDRSVKAVTWNDKYHKHPDETARLCPAPVDEQLAARLRELSRVTFSACYCRDYSRVDIRIDRSGNPFVLEINSMASLGEGGAFVLAAKTAGYTFSGLVCRILDVAHERYFGVPAPRDTRATRPTDEPSCSAPGIGPSQVAPFAESS
jgi:D-alanine-D-alanine ligase